MKRPLLSYREEHVRSVHYNLELLAALVVGLGPVRVIFLADLALFHNSLHLLHHSRRHLH